MPVTLERRSWFWPVMLFPHIERSHTVEMIGWRGWRPVVVKDVVAAYAGRIVLTEERLVGRGRLGGLGGWIEVDRPAIESVRPSPRGDTLLEVRYNEARKSRMLRHLTRGPLDGVVLLNLGDALGRWLAELGGGPA